MVESSSPRSPDAEAVPSKVFSMQVHLKISKTDQLRKGTDIYIGKTDDDICPVAAMLAFLAVRGQTPGPLFICHDGKPCTKDWFISFVQLWKQRGSSKEGFSLSSTAMSPSPSVASGQSGCH